MPKKKLSARSKSQTDKKNASSATSRERIKKLRHGEIFTSDQKKLRELGRGLKKKSFSQLERLIKLARKVKNKSALQH
jgi:hypothetical protein